MRTSIMLLIFFTSQILVTLALALSSNTDKLALLALKEKLTNGVSDSLPSWNESQHFCKWQGVTCGHHHMRVTILYLKNQNLGGTLGPSLGNLTFLQNLTLSNINLHGEIPKQIGRLKRLRILHLGNNALQGEIPIEITNCTNIQGLALELNSLFGTFPSDMHLAFPNIKQLLVGGNQLSGKFPSSISNLTKLRRLDMSFNAFNGPIPLTLGQLNKLEWFDIGNNSFGSGGVRDLDFLFSLTNCTQLFSLIFFKNNFGGELPDLIGNFSSNLKILHMGENQIHGVIPETIGQLTGLTYLNIGSNFLEGTISSSIGKLENLVKLTLQSNKLHGNIPNSIGNLTMLIDLYLDENNLEGNIPFSLRHCTQLKYIVIFGNKLSGDIPKNTFIYLEGLVNIYLENNFLTGSIPSELGSLKHLSTLALNSNKLSGEIPKDLGNCLTLTVLLLGGNFFHGSIPSFLGNLRSLEILNISYNNFSSKIPFELENLTRLNTLDLSFNNLEGEVPKGGVFSNFTSISLSENNNLCGGIPQLKLHACLPPKKHKIFFKRKIIIVISVIGGVLTSFIAFIIVHFLTRKPKRLPSDSLKNGNLRVTYRELHEATNGFSSSNLVGSGSFGSVYKCHLLYFERLIAVKVLNLEARGAAKSFTAECNALGKMKHRNLVKILTCCSSSDYNGEDFKAIVFEFMPNGSLEMMLHNNEGYANDNLSLTKMVDIALDVTHALDYLHNETDQVVVHCDIKPSNVLLDNDIVAHLGDFGLARLIHGATSNSSKDQVSSSRIKGTIGYVPPEYGAGGLVSPSGDIYSYGILLLEMLTGKRPTDNMFSESLSLHEFCKSKISEGILEIVDSRLLTPFAEDQTGIVEKKIKTCLVMFARIGVSCSKEFPPHRMSMKDVIVKLNEIKSKFP